MKISVFIFIVIICSQYSWAQTIDFKLFESSGANVRKEVGKNQATFKQIRKEQQQYLKGQKKRYTPASASL